MKKTNKKYKIYLNLVNREIFKSRGPGVRLLVLASWLYYLRQVTQHLCASHL